MNIVELIRAETAGHRERIAAIEGDRCVSYGELLDRVAAHAAVLRELGLGPSKRVGLLCRDGIDYIIGSLTLLDAGAAVVPLSDSLTAAELQQTIATTDVHGVLSHRELASPGSEVIPSFHWQPRAAQGLRDEQCRQLNAAFIRFSSGTTGASKGVLLSHETIRDRTDAANMGLQITSEDVILWVLQMSHHFVVSILLFLRQGATIVLAGGEFPFSLLDAVSKHRFTFMYASPVHYHLLAGASSVPADALRDVRLAISTAMKMPQPISRAFAAKFGFAPAEAYGIIEVGLPFVNTRPRPGVGSVGPVLPGYQLQIRCADESGAGDVYIRGKGMFDAYLSPWQLREQALDNGWFRTGDVGRIDDGELVLLGRVKTVIVSAGMKVFPEEVEEVINVFPGVAESLVRAAEHAVFGQIPVADVVLSTPLPDPAPLLRELRRHCCQKLSSYKVPAEFRVVARLARTPSGKIVRR